MHHHAPAPDRSNPGSLPSPVLPAVDQASIAEAIPHIVWTASPDGSTTYFNRQGTDYTGCPPETNYGYNWVTLVHPDDAERARAAWTDAVRAETEFALDYRIRRFDGEYRWHSFRARPLRDTRGTTLMWVGTATDVEDQKTLEHSLRRSEAQAQETLTLLQSIEASAPVGFKLIDHDFRIIRINERLAAINHLPVEEQLGRTVAEVVPDLWPQLEGVYQRALHGEAVSNLELTTVDSDAPEGIRHWLASYYPVRVDGTIVGVGNVVVDITERKVAERALARNLDAMVETIAMTVECRDPYTAGHQRRVAGIAAAIASELGIDPHAIEGIRTAASIHDIGKISVPAEILSKPGRLSTAEFELIKEHPVVGYNIVHRIDFPWPVAEMIRQHHERMDGSGYPDGLRGPDILVGSRIIAVADIIEAMVSHRPYRPGHSVDSAIGLLLEGRGKLLDADVVDACVRVFSSGSRFAGQFMATADAPRVASPPASAGRTGRPDAAATT